MKKWGVFLLVAVVLVASCTSNDEEPFEAEIIAEAVLYDLELVGDNEYETLQTQIGTASFAQDGDVVRLQITLSGMEPGTYKAVHIHEGSLATPQRHWNGGSVFASCDSISLGSFWGKPFIGDVGNVEIGSDGEGVFTISTDLWSINSGDLKDVVGRPIIIHDSPQDFSEECDPNHSHGDEHTNPKIAGGTIELLSGEPVNTNARAVIEITNEVPDFLICN